MARSTARRPRGRWRSSPAGRARPRTGARRRAHGAPPPARLTERQRGVLDALADGPRRSPSWRAHDTVRRLEARGLVAVERRELARAAPRRRASATRAPRALTPAQADGARRARARASRARPSSSTASPARARPRSTCARRRGRWTPAGARSCSCPRSRSRRRPSGRFRARFGDTVAVLHSALGEGERADEWRRLARGEARICVGPRSAVFAPVGRPRARRHRRGARASYKHEGDPRYDARRVAALARAPRGRDARGRQRDAAAREPPPPAPARAARADRRPAAPARRAARHARRRRTPIHPETRRALAESPKSIVLLNRRGWSNFLSCRSCGQVWECPECDVALVLHRGAGLCLPPLRPPRAASRPLRRVRLGVGRPPRRGHAAARGRARGGARRARCSGSTPTSRRARTASPRCSARSPPRPRACSSARRSWPRGTTSPTSRSASCSTPTRRSASPTSAPRSGRSRSSPSSPAAPAAAGRRPRARADARPRRPALAFAAEHDAEGFLAARARPPRGARLPAVRDADPGRLLGARRRRRRTAAAALRARIAAGGPAVDRPGPRAALPPPRPRARPAGDQGDASGAPRSPPSGTP